MANIVWNDTKTGFLHACWLAGTKTKLIAERYTKEFGEFLSKNAAVGKIHRMMDETPADWPSRPNPIRKRLEPVANAPPIRAALPPLPPLPCLKLPRQEPQAARVKLSVPLAPVVVLRPPEVPRRPARDPTQPIRRGDNSGCLFPKGHPRQPGFCFCDADLYDLGKPYCRACAKEAYVNWHKPLLR